jgi:putative oxidoreductase
MSLESALSPWAPRTLSLLRIISGLLLFVSGWMKVYGYPEYPGYPAPPFDITTLTGVAGAIETAGGILLALGLFTRPAAFVCSGQMAFAYFLGHAGQSFWPQINGGFAPLLLCFIFFHFVFAGGGSISVDALLAKRRR